ncbi:hypothetical protein GCM10010174_25870 [Kutzneria viridogrisea]|uniref:Uncharacterized protein n=1 Tax=Kutzneria viridogrisea TaxID=47990 RepID=A0ABR6BSB8_9PSEU|nr:hypothetical protein [Kutzneria viridogrisea]
MLSRVHFTVNPGQPGAVPACEAGARPATRAVTGNPAEVTCPACQITEDYSALADYLACAAEVPEATDTEPDRITALRRHLTGSAQKIDGVLVDNLTAQAIITVHDALTPATRAKLAHHPYPVLARIAWACLR